jgi:hypothetical protein
VKFLRICFEMSNQGNISSEVYSLLSTSTKGFQIEMTFENFKTLWKLKFEHKNVNGVFNSKSHTFDKWS